MFRSTAARVLVLAFMLIAGVPAVSGVAQDCSVIVKAEKRYIGDGVAQLDFEWTPTAGAEWYRLKVMDSEQFQREYLFKGDLGALIPMSDFINGRAYKPLPGTYAYELTALDADQNEICCTVPGLIKIERVYTGGGLG
jgi:hypothetical protein